MSAHRHGVSASEDNVDVETQTLSLDPTKGHVVSEWKHDRPMNGVRFDPQARYVIGVSEDAVASRFQLSDGTRTVMSGGFRGWGRALAFSTDGKYVITGSTDGNITWWETAAERPTPMHTTVAHEGWVRCMESSPDGTLLATGGNDHIVRVWNAESGEPVFEFRGHESHIYSVMFHPGGQWLLSGDLMGVVRQWDLVGGTEVRTFDAQKLHSYNGGQRVHYGGVRSLAVSPDGKWLAAGGLFDAPNPFAGVNKPLALLFDWESQKIEQEHVSDGLSRAVIWRLRWLADGSLMGVAAGSESMLLFWKSETAGDYHRLKLPSHARDMDLHPDGLHVATANHDNHVRIVRLSEKTASEATG